MRKNQEHLVCMDEELANVNHDQLHLNIYITSSERRHSWKLMVGRWFIAFQNGPLFGGHSFMFAGMYYVEYSFLSHHSHDEEVTK